MNEKQLNEKIRTAVEHAAPDKLDTILSSVSEKKGVTAMTKTTKRKPIFAFAAAAAAFALCVGLLGYNGHIANATDSIITLDVNPSIKIETNRKDKVLEVNALNADAKTVIGEMDFKGASLEVTVNALIGSMLQKGFITDVQNAVLVTVENDDDAKSMLLTNELSGLIGEAFKADSLDGAVISQSAKVDDSTHALAEQLGISDGKAMLISEIAKQDETLTPEALANMSVGEIMLISDSKNIIPETVQKNGSASEKAYIGKDKALEIAKAEAMKTETEGKFIDINDAFTNIEVEFDSEDGKMVYEVELDGIYHEYEYDIDAISGAIIKAKKDPHRAPANPPVETQPPKPAVTTVPAVTQQNPPATTPPAELMTREEALAKALAHAGVAKENISDLSIDLDEDDGRVHFDIEFDTAKADYDYEVDAVSGAIIKAEKDLQDDFDDDDDD